MADSYIALDEPSTVDKKLDTEQLTVGANTVERERVQIAGTGATQIAPVSATDGLLVNLGANNDVTVTSSALPTGAATAAKQPALGTAGTASADVITVQGIASMTALKVDGSAVTQPVSAASLPLPTGAATETTLGTRLTESDFDTKVGSLTETAPATDTASSGLNGRLQRIAQRLTSLITLLPSSLGTKTAANSLGVTLASDDPAVATLGATTGTKVITDANGTIQQYLRGLVYLAITSGGWLVTATIAAGTALIGKVSASAETDTIYSGTTALTPKFAKIAASSSGNNAIVAAVTSKKIRVLRYSLVANGTVNAKFQSDGGGTPTDLTGLVYCVANMGAVEPYCPVGLFESGSGKSLDLNLSGAVAVGGSLTYIEV